MPTTASLDGPRAKINRAEQKLDALSGEIRQAMEGDLYTVVGEPNTAEESYSIFLEEKAEIPILDWGLTLGEILHNARGALDHLVAQLVVLADGRVHTRHQFPIVKGEDDWNRLVVEPPKNGKRGMLDFMAPAHVAVSRVTKVAGVRARLT